MTTATTVTMTNEAALVEEAIRRDPRIKRTREHPAYDAADRKWLGSYGIPVPQEDCPLEAVPYDFDRHMPLVVVPCRCKDRPMLSAVEFQSPVPFRPYPTAELRPQTWAGNGMRRTAYVGQCPDCMTIFHATTSR